MGIRLPGFTHPAGCISVCSAAVAVIQQSGEVLDEVARVAGLTQAERRPERAESELNDRAVMAAVAIAEGFASGDVADLHGFHKV
jgi:hypothetical protein